MNIQQLCDYLNEIGIIDMNNIKHFLQISTYMMNDKINNQSIKSINDIYKISLFSYIREIINDDKKLYKTCANIINSYKRYIILKKYNSLFLFKKIIYLKVYQRYKTFITLLYKKFPFKSYRTNKYHQNKKKKINNKTCTNNFYSPINNDLNNEIMINTNAKRNKINKVIDYNDNNNNNNNIDINKNIIKFKKQESDNIKFENYKFMKELSPSKRKKKIDINICIAQSNINFEKFFINKKLILCKKNHSYLSYIDRIKSNKKELYSKNPYEYSYSSFTLRKNKSETKLRIKKILYEEKTRLNNFETIEPKMKRELKKRAKSKKEEELGKKRDEDNKFNKLIEKEIDTKNWVDRLYRENYINQKKEQREKKNEINKKNKNTPINWEQIYLETNEKIIKNSKEQKLNKSSSYFMPKRGRIYKYNTIETENKNNNDLIMSNNKINKTIETNCIINNETSINKDNNKSVKISLELNNDNKNLNPNMNSNNSFPYEIKESELNSINSEKNENDNKINEKNNTEKKEENEKINEEENNSNNISNNNDTDYLDRQKKFDKNNNISPQGFRSKGIQELLMKRKINQDINQKAPEINFNDSHNEQKENEEKKEEIHESGDKTDFNNLLSSNNDTTNII